MFQLNNLRKFIDRRALKCTPLVPIGLNTEFLENFHNISDLAFGFNDVVGDYVDNVSWARNEARLAHSGKTHVVDNDLKRATFQSMGGKQMGHVDINPTRPVPNVIEMI